MTDVDESLRGEWEASMARQAMDVGVMCDCGHGQLEHGETRCQRCACGLAWHAREFEQNYHCRHPYSKRGAK